MENDPLEPGLAVTPTLADLRAGRDVVLDAAERALERGRTRQASAPVAPR